VIESLADLHGAETVDKFLEKVGLQLDFVFELDVSGDLESLANRVAHRLVHVSSGRTYNVKSNPPKIPGKDDITGEPLTQRSEDAEKAILRVENWKERGYEQISYYEEKKILQKINAGGNIEEVFNEICFILENEENIQHILEKRENEIKNLNIERLLPIQDEYLARVAQPVTVKESCAVMQALFLATDFAKKKSNQKAKISWNPTCHLV